MSEKITKEDKKKLKEERSNNFWNSAIGIIIEAAVLFVVSSIIAMLAVFVASLLERTNPLASFLLKYYVPVAIAGIVFIIYMAKNHKDILATLKYGYKKNNILTFISGIIIGFVMNSLAILVAYLSGCVNFKSGTLGIAGIICFLVCSMQCMAEEVIARCFIYGRAIKRYSAFVAIILSSAFFAAAHLMNPGATVLSVASTFLAGVFFALTVYYFDNIYIAFGIHSMWNFNQNFIFGLPNSGLASISSFMQLDGVQQNNIFSYDIIYGVEASVFGIILWCAFSAIAILVGSKIKNEKVIKLFQK